jgi:adenylosuccinate lyase
MKFTHHTSISPLDGRYYKNILPLKDIFSEFALNKYRLNIEIEYFLYFSEVINDIEFTKEEKTNITNIYNKFNEDLSGQISIKQYERITNHDVKAVEYFIKEQLNNINLGKYGEFVHFGLTSQDINSMCYVMQIRDYITKLFLPYMEELIDNLSKLSKKCDIPMLGRTHGQAASPTTMKKEIQVFIYKLDHHLKELKHIKYYSKFGGAVGNMNAHYVAYPDVIWENALSEFVELFDIIRHPYTTQIDNYDFYSTIFDLVKRIQTVLIDFNQDIWTYISMDYFKLKKIKGEIGSSTMPHKVNPINFENAEGNLQLSNTLLEFLSRKLPTSRLQRDLTDSTVLRNIGVAFGYGFIALQSMIKGIDKLEINKNKISNELDSHWIITMEAIQTILRREKIESAYEKTKDFICKYPFPEKENIHEFIETLEVTKEIKDELKQITPKNYIGFLAKDFEEQ